MHAMLTHACLKLWSGIWMVRNHRTTVAIDVLSETTTEKSDAPPKVRKQSRQDDVDSKKEAKCAVSLLSLGSNKRDETLATPPTLRPCPHEHSWNLI